MIVPSFQFAHYDVSEMLPSGWQEDLRTCARLGSSVDQQGLSLGPGVGDGRSLRYLVTSGETVGQRLPWLKALYATEFRRLAEEVHGSSMDLANDVARGVNLNYLVGPGDSYEWHLDTNPLTGLLFGNDLQVGEGGELLFVAPQFGVEMKIRPRAGVLLFFDARAVPHTIEPLGHEVERVSAPMNYYLAGADQRRPDGLDEHIYGGKRDKN